MPPGGPYSVDSRSSRVRSARRAGRGAGGEASRAGAWRESGPGDRADVLPHLPEVGGHIRGEASQPTFVAEGFRFMQDVQDPLDLAEWQERRPQVEAQVDRPLQGRGSRLPGRRGPPPPRVRGCVEGHARSSAEWSPPPRGATRATAARRPHPWSGDGEGARAGTSRAGAPSAGARRSRAALDPGPRPRIDRAGRPG